MKVLQTLGRQSGQHGIFQYKRISTGVLIDISIGTAEFAPDSEFLITNKEWRSILKEIKKHGILNLTGSPSAKGTCLHDLIKKAVPQPENFTSWNDSYLAYVCAILEHEGSIIFYAGSAGQGQGISLHLAATEA